MRIIDWSSDVFSSDLLQIALVTRAEENVASVMPGFTHLQSAQPVTLGHHLMAYYEMIRRDRSRFADARTRMNQCPLGSRSEEHTSELQSLMRISYAVFCLKKKTKEKKMNETIK